MIPQFNELRELAARAETGDPDAYDELQRRLDQSPELWQNAGDLALRAEEMWLTLLAGRDLGLRESVDRKMNELITSLGGDLDTPLEQLLIQRIRLCWLATYYLELIALQNREASRTTAKLIAKRQAIAQRQFLAAVKALAMVRKLLPGSSKRRPKGEGTDQRAAAQVSVSETVQHEISRLVSGE